MRSKFLLLLLSEFKINFEIILFKYDKFSIIMEHVIKIYFSFQLDILVVGFFYIKIALCSKYFIDLEYITNKKTGYF
jgi:hypothetical protein